MHRFVDRYSTRGQDEWTPLFYTVLHSRIRDWMRREKVRNRFRVWFGITGREEEGNPIENLPDVNATDPERQLLNDRGLKQLEQAIRILPVRQQQAVMLRLLEGLDVTQTAKVMKCSTGSVKTHYSRAIRTLREHLGEHWP